MAQQQLELVLEDVIDGEPVRPSSIPVGLLSEFHGQVARFLKGGYAEVDLNSVRVGIEVGSYKVVVPAMALVAGMLSDVALLFSGNLDDMDAKRASVIEEWQKAARRDPARRYGLRAGPDRFVQIHAGSHFERHENAKWTRVEKYLLGQVIDLGGKKPNLHLQLAGGAMVKVNTSLGQVLDQEENLVYRQALLRVRAEEDLHTGKLRNAHLVEFVRYQPVFDPQAFDAMVAKGRKAWADVPNVSDWVDEQRGAG